MKRYVDLHSHYLPGIDDGVTSFDDGVRLVQGLGALGYEVVVATPHIRSAMFENRKPGLEAAFSNFRDAASHLPDIPTLGLGAEHHFDDVVWALFLEGQAVPYPGGHGALIEFPERAFPMGVEHRFFELMVKGIRPVIAHPERYLPLFKKTDPIDPLLEVGALPLLDVMSLAGRYGRHPQRAAERMVKEGVYYAACTDAHRLSDLPLVEEAIERLRRLVGEDEAEELLADHPRAILEGRVVS